MATVQAILCRKIAARAEELRDDLAAHVAIPTGHNHTQGLDEYRGVITSRLEQIGAKVELVAGDPKPEWLTENEDEGAIPPVAICRHAEEGLPRIMLAGHLDTVFPPDGAFNRMTISSDGKLATGPGVVDMKGGVLITVAALEALADAGVNVSWTFLLNSDEEKGSYHSARVLDKFARQHDFGIAMEPALPDGSLAIARKGSGQFKIEAFGRSAHAGREFEKGVSAVYALAQTLSKIEAFCDLERGVTLNIGPIVGGKATNIVPDYAAAWGNIRYPDQQSADEVGAAMDALATTGNDLPKIVMHRSFSRPAKPTTPAVKHMAERARLVAESLGQQLPFASTGGVCDGNILQGAGLPTIDTLGVRGGGLHTTEEWIELDSLVERAQLMACFLHELTERGTQ